MKIIYYTFFIIFSCISIAEGQNTFEKIYGSNLFEEAKSVRQTTDGGYIIGTNLVKIDDLGNEEWSQLNPTLLHLLILLMIKDIS